MKPINFLGQNTVYAKNQPEYIPLPGYKAESPNGEFISCWKLSFMERLILLFTGKLWVSLLTFNGPLTPSFFTVKQKEVLLTLKMPLKLKFRFFFEWQFRNYFGGFCEYLTDRVGVEVRKNTDIKELWVNYQEETLLNEINKDYLGENVEMPPIKQ